MYVWVSQNYIIIHLLNYNTHNSSFSRLCDDNAIRAEISNINAIVFSGNNLPKKKGKRKREYNFTLSHSVINATRTHDDNFVCKQNISVLFFFFVRFSRALYYRSVNITCTHAIKNKLLNRVFGRNCLF